MLIYVFHLLVLKLSPGETRLSGAAESWLSRELHESFLQLSTLGPNDENSVDSHEKFEHVQIR